jgi:hypothetical protein
VLALPDVLRPFEHEVLGKVRKAGLPGRLDAAPDVIGDVHRDDRNAGQRDTTTRVIATLRVERNIETKAGDRRLST